MVVEVCDTIECLSNSPQRLRVLEVLEGEYADLRDLMDQLDSPRSTLQRNLSVLEERDWIKATSSGYTTTTAGCLILRGFVRLNETVETIESTAAFFDAVDAPGKVDIWRLNAPRVTRPESERPNAPTKRLVSIFRESDRVRALLPIVSYFSIEHSRRVDADDIPECECVLSLDAFNTLRQQYADGDGNEIELEPPAHVTIRVYGGTLPYGLFVSDETLALTAYNDIGRIQALVESTSDETVEWGEQVYEKYRHQAKQPHETDIADRSYEPGTVD